MSRRFPSSVVKAYLLESAMRNPQLQQSSHTTLAVMPSLPEILAHMASRPLGYSCEVTFCGPPEITEPAQNVTSPISREF